MTEEEIKELLAHCPTLFHMAEHGSWPSIQQRGLLSTTALLDLYGVEGDERITIESRRRSGSVRLRHPQLPDAVIRDQIPMDDRGLQRCLPPHLTPADWYRNLNKKVFFWLSKERLFRLLGAGAYQGRTHHVLEINAHELIAEYRDAIWLCPINSGCTKPYPHPRDEQTFLRIGQYPYSMWRQKRPRGERVVELAIDYSVPDIRRFVRRVVEMRGTDELRVLYDS